MHLRHAENPNVVVDNNFDYKMETMTVNGIVLLKTPAIEVRHVYSTLEESEESIQSTEKFLNVLIGDNYIRVVDSVIDAELVEEKKEENHNNQFNESHT